MRQVEHETFARPGRGLLVCPGREGAGFGCRREIEFTCEGQYHRSVVLVITPTCAGMTLGTSFVQLGIRREAGEHAYRGTLYPAVK
ncbi:hypothetical protein Amsp01_089560 [Amycolatopsis sp. NBRC 101858]|nr:hypothetical protein Amsp01_089560 [Amycolatopsis sp. NBRC 101858]